ILIFISTIIIVIIVAKLASQIIEGAGFGVLNKIGGVAFGIMRGVLILGFFFMVFEGINQRERFANRNTLESTIFYYPVLDAGEFMLPYLPIEKVKEVFNEFSIPKEEVKTEDDK
ncbi:MAG: CvpA family protein, partial [Rikenellaceae bacterium]